MSVNYCPSCGKPIQYDDSFKAYVCYHCMVGFDIEDLYLRIGY